MTTQVTSSPLFLNPGAPRLVDLAGFGPPDRGPLDYHRKLPGYAQTPLVDLPEVAQRLGVGRVVVKDEAERLGLPSYKILGASWATYQEVLATLQPDLQPWSTVEELAAQLQSYGSRRLVAATDGNHGRAVARMAKHLGWEATIFVPVGTVDARIEGISSEGAEVVVVDGTYDEAVERAAQEADDRSLVISDTAWPGYERVPRWVVEGYSTLFNEADDAMAAQSVPPVTHVSIQVGVGALAAAAVRRYRATEDTAGVTMIGVEPVTAACVLHSMEAGELVDVPGPHDSIMAGLNCGRPSPLAWPLVSNGLHAAIAVDDERAREAMRLLATGGVVSGESGAAGLAGLLALVDEHPQAAAQLGLDGDAVVLLVNTEGATDPEAYRAVVGG
jgi:diaminopropionate ammonia-lyase